MGLIRFLLAISVLLAHMNTSTQLIGGSAAVQIFFMISGFYMALILSEKYVGNNSYFLFLTNRLLRIFPSYWITLLVSVLLLAISHFLLSRTPSNDVLNNLSSMDWRLSTSIVISNIFLIGQDWLLFLNIDQLNNITVAKSLDVTYPSISVNYLIIPQAWTLALEIIFYLLAPFIVRKSTPIIALITAALIILRIVISTHFNLNSDPWSYRFFIFELPFFLLGILAYRAYRNLIRIHHLGYLPIYALLLSILLLGTYSSLSKIPNKEILLYALIALMLPLIFISTKTNKLDRMIGELSYPIYLTHVIVIGCLGKVGIHSITITIATSIMVAIILSSTIELPIEKYRQRRIESEK